MSRTSEGNTRRATTLQGIVPKSLPLRSLKRGVSKPMRILALNVKKEYFDAIKDGAKTEEYRIVKTYWETRLSKDYDEVHILCGYPRKDDVSKRLIFPYRGWVRKDITHKHFGNEPVKVFAIRLANNLATYPRQSLQETIAAWDYMLMAEQQDQADCEEGAVEK